MWLGKVATTFTYKTSLLHRISLLKFFNLKIKKVYIFSFHSSLGVLIFTFDIMFELLTFLRYEEQWEQCKIYYCVLLKGKNQTNVKQGIILHLLV